MTEKTERVVGDGALFLFLVIVALAAGFSLGLAIGNINGRLEIQKQVETNSYFVIDDTVYLAKPITVDQTELNDWRFEDD